LLEPADEVLLRQWLAKEGVFVAAPQLLFRASRHGWGAADFHRCCDGQGRTLVLVRSTTGHVFGGYASEEWGSGGGGVPAPGSFLFCITAAEGGVAPAKIHMVDSQQQHALLHDHRLGPVFGDGCDLFIADAANSNEHSNHNMGTTYVLPPGARGRDFLTAHPHGNFCVDEYEVWGLGRTAK
jgi:hypothetical protein